MRKIKNPLFFLLSLLFVVSSCSSDDSISGNNPVTGEYSQGVFILNEGKFMTSNTADVSFLSNEGIIENDIYSGVNAESLGDTAQSIGMKDDKMYIVVNNSNHIKVVNRYTMELITTISSDIQSPRFITFHNGYGYITNWGDPSVATDDYIAVLGLNSNQVIQKISVAEGPEMMEVVGNKLYVAHKGGWGIGNTVSVIDLSSKSVISSITVADTPSGIKASGNYLYVLCTGYESWSPEFPSTQGGLYKIDTTTNQIVSSLLFAEGSHPTQLDKADSKLYFTVGANVYQMNESDNSLPQTPFISLSGVYNFYGFAVHGDKIYISDPKDYNSNGQIYVYSILGEYLADYQVGIVPNGFYFND